MTKVHVLPHTHWDREWYFTQQDSEVLAAYNFTKVIETLENNAGYHCYHLDGQSAIVEDYLKVMPHMHSRMASLVKSEKLFIGPWYTQTDSFNVAGESIIRNLKYGMHIAQQLGHTMKVGYLPDTFGHNAQIPTLFNGVGIDNTLFWRGIDFDQQVQRSNFLWTSPGGDTLIACNLVHGYGAAKNIVDTPAHLDNKIFPMVEKIKQLSGLDEVLIPSGGDQVNIDPRLPEVLAVATERSTTGDVYVISSMEAYMDYLRTQQAGFEHYVGEFKTPRYTRIHKTIGSVRYDIKKLNFDIEQFLLKKLEVVIAIAMAHSITVHTSLVDIAWKKILECHAHDSMGGCNSDDTNADIMHRLKQAQEIVHGLYNLIVKEIAAGSCDDGDLLLFNNRLMPYSGTVDVTVFSQSEHVAIMNGEQALLCEVVQRTTMDGGMVIEVTKDGEKEVPVANYYRFDLKLWVDELPALGYQRFQVASAETSVALSSDQYPLIENEYYTLELVNQRLVLTDKLQNRRIDDAIRFESVADDGDSYDFSPLGDAPLLLTDFEWLDTHIGQLTQQMRLRGQLAVPNHLENRKTNTCDGLIEVELRIVLQRGNSQLSVQVITENTVEDHRLRALINTDVISDTSIATQPFALMSRAINNEGYSATDWQNTYREAPVDIETTDSVVAIEQADRAVVVTGAGIKEFQILEGNPHHTIALTLFKSVGVLGKDNLQWRPGRASGINNKVVHTPDAQLKKVMSFEFAIALTGDASHQTVRSCEQAYLTTPFGYQRQKLNSFEHRLERFQVRFDAKTLPSFFSLLSVKEPVELSSISHSLHDSNTVFLRLFNATAQPVTVDLQQFEAFTNVAIVNYCETVLPEAQPVVRPNNTLDLRLVMKD